MTGREKEIIRHLSVDDLDRLLNETDSEKLSKRLTFVKRLYKGATLEDAADDVGISQSIGIRWVTLWSKGQSRTSHTELQGRSAPETQ
jgi:transposase